jgi:4'-phosphopantetheinyl transferase
VTVKLHTWASAIVEDSSSERERVLSLDERRRADGFSNSVLRTRWVAARAFLKETIGQHLGVEARALSFTYSAQGKPLLRGGPFFSLSHCPHFALVAVCDQVDVGVDIECVHRFSDPTLERHTLHVDELALLKAEQTRAERTLSVAATWTRKEACLKAVGVGLGTSPDAISLGSVGKNDGQWVSIHGETCWVRNLRHTGDHSSAGAALNHEFRWISHRDDARI